jgi:hypothetical protein
MPDPIIPNPHAGEARFQDSGGVHRTPRNRRTCFCSFSTRNSTYFFAPSVCAAALHKKKLWPLDLLNDQGCRSESPRLLVVRGWAQGLPLLENCRLICSVFTAKLAVSEDIPCA